MSEPPIIVSPWTLHRYVRLSVMESARHVGRAAIEAGLSLTFDQCRAAEDGEYERTVRLATEAVLTFLRGQMSEPLVTLWAFFDWAMEEG